MYIKELAYSCMSMKQLNKHIARTSAKLEVETNQKKRMRLIDDHFDVINALIRKNRNDEKFRQYVDASIKVLLLETTLKKLEKG